MLGLDYNIFVFKIFGTVLLEISKVSYSYGGNSVFSGVSLSVAPGSFYFLTGPSGSGKTTFINLCAGALVPEVGNISAVSYTHLTLPTKRIV